MNFIKSKIDLIIDILSSSDYFDDVKIISAYPSEKKPTLIKKPGITISFKSVEINESFYLDSCRNKKITLGINFYLPLTMDSIEITGFLTNVIELLVFKNELDVNSVKCAEPSYNREIDAFMVKSEFQINEPLYINDSMNIN